MLRVSEKVIVNPVLFAESFVPYFPGLELKNSEILSINELKGIDHKNYLRVRSLFTIKSINHKISPYVGSILTIKSLDRKNYPRVRLLFNTYWIAVSVNFRRRWSPSPDSGTWFNN